MQKSIAILCAGGPAPGINTVIGTVSKRFIEKGFRVLGLHQGYRTLFAEKTNYVEIDYYLADTIFSKGGSYLIMDRYKPQDQEFKADFFSKNNVKLLVTIGGDDTASTANRISKFLEKENLDVKNIHVPKTIDNDLPLPDNLPTFGFVTAANEGVRLARTVYEDAKTSGNWFIISSMGREAGHLAFTIGKSLHFPMIIIPEMFHNKKPTFSAIIRMIISAIIKRKLMGLSYGAVIISEGLFHFMEEQEIINSSINLSYDEHGHPELGKVSKAHIFNELLSKELEKLDINIKTRPVEIGYEIRCTSPSAFDLDYCTSLANGVLELYQQNKTSCIVIVDHKGTVLPLYLRDIENEEGKIKPRLVDTNSNSYQNVFQSLACIKEEDYKKAENDLDNPAYYNLTNILS